MFPAPAKAPIVSAPPKSTVLPLAIVTVATSESMLAAVVTSFPAFTFTADPPVQPPPFKVNVPAPFLFTLWFLVPLVAFRVRLAVALVMSI